MLQVDQKAQFWAFILSHTQVSNGRLNDPPHPMAHHGTFKNWWKRELRALPAVTWRIKPTKSSKFSMPYVCVSDSGGCLQQRDFGYPICRQVHIVVTVIGDFPFYLFNIRFYLLLVLNSQWPSQLVLVIWKAFRRKLKQHHISSIKIYQGGRFSHVLPSISCRLHVTFSCLGMLRLFYYVTI